MQIIKKIIPSFIKKFIKETYFYISFLKEFTLIPDNGQEEGIIYNASKSLADSQRYGCGCFWFTKN